MGPASPFSFHCIVCIEEFDTAQRFPVVLPCGHTYVCNECACRLDKCMECRTSLSIMLPNSAARAPLKTPNYQRRGQVRPGWDSSRTETIAPPVTRRLPLPKNIVLMSLMETTALMGQESLASTMESPIQQPQSMGDNEEENIRVGTSLAIGTCGTYVITKVAVPVFPSRPTTEDFQRSYNELTEDEDVDDLVRYFHMDNEIIHSDVVLKRGDRVQIVSLEDGWAKLARGYGFIRAEGGQLVKVGPSVDRACKLEALLRSIAVRRKAFKHEKALLDSQVIVLMRDLHSSLMQDDDCTVVGAETFGETDTSITHLNLEERDNESSVRSNVPEDIILKAQVNNSSLSAKQTGPSQGPVEEISTDQRGTGFFGGTPFDHPDLMAAMSFGSLACGSTNSMAAAHQSNDHALSAAAVNFRTGLSGHNGVSLTSTHVRPAADSNPLRKMSIHGGLSLPTTSRPAPLFHVQTSGSSSSVASAPSRLITPPRKPHAWDYRYARPKYG